MPALPLLALAYVAGCIASATLGGAWWLTVAGAAGLAALAASTVKPRPSVLVLAAAIALAGIGHLRFQQASTTPARPLASIEGSHEIVGVAREDATILGTTARVTLHVETLDGAPKRGGIRVTFRAPALEEALPAAGDRVRVTGKLTPPRADTVEYATYLRDHGIDAAVAFPQRWGVIERGTDPPPIALLRDIRRWGLRNLERSLPEPPAALATGVLIGEQRGLPKTVTDALRATGTTHLVVVSGHTTHLNNL